MTKDSIGIIELGKEDVVKIPGESVQSAGKRP